MITLERYFELNEVDVNILHKKTINHKSLNKYIKQFKYIDVNELWFDDPNNPELNNWIDIEGIGYGWLWLRHKNSKKQQRKDIIRHAIGCTSCVRNEYYTDIDNDVVVLYMLCKDLDCVIVVQLSNKDLETWW